METTEKIAFLYLRFNGFFLMPHFTVFGVGEERHVDVLGFRVVGSEERVGESLLITDEAFIKNLKGDKDHVAVWAEVSTSSKGNLFPDKKLAYCARMFGNKHELKKVYFDFNRQGEDFAFKNEILVVPVGRCIKFLLERFSQMESTPVKDSMDGLTKTGSWAWSDSFLADLLYLRKIGFLRQST